MQDPCKAANSDKCSSKFQWEAAVSKQVFLKFHYIHGKTPALELLFNKVTGLKNCNIIKKILKHRRFPVNIANVLIAAFSQNTSSDCFYSMFCWKKQRKTTGTIQYKESVKVEPRLLLISMLESLAKLSNNLVLITN